MDVARGNIFTWGIYGYGTEFVRARYMQDVLEITLRARKNKDHSLRIIKAR